MTDSSTRIPLTVEGIERALERSRSPGSNVAYIESLRARLKEFEDRYEMRADLLGELLASGRVRETADLAKFAIIAESLAELEKKSTATDQEGGSAPQ